uniref:Uncharacterized protein n=1 Tax=Arundo donax TaxID=35708 RepID=A0A0A9BK57_ARUDO
MWGTRSRERSYCYVVHFDRAVSVRG